MILETPSNSLNKDGAMALMGCYPRSYCVAFGARTFVDLQGFWFGTDTLSKVFFLDFLELFLV